MRDVAIPELMFTVDDMELEFERFGKWAIAALRELAARMKRHWCCSSLR